MWGGALVEVDRGGGGGVLGGRQGAEVLQLPQVPQLDAVGGAGGQVVPVLAEGHARHRPRVPLELGHVLCAAPPPPPLTPDPAGAATAASFRASAPGLQIPSRRTFHADREPHQDTLLFALGRNSTPRSTEPVTHLGRRA